MASESVRALNEKIARDNLFKAKAVGETQASFRVSRKSCILMQHQRTGRDRRLQMLEMSAEKMYLLSDADEKRR